MRILLTAFESYDDWDNNSSWLALVELLRDSSQDFELTTRRYPVNLPALEKKLNEDLEHSFDAVLHLGQAPGSSAIKLETVALNVAGCVDERGELLPEIIPSGPLAFRTRMPVGLWAGSLREAHIPAFVSYHAGTFLCNATMYLSHYWYHSRDLATPVGFVHLPLATEQVAQSLLAKPSLPKSTLATAIKLILNDLRNWSSDANQRQRLA